MRTREQERSLHVYDCVAELDTSLHREYKTLARDLGANVMRSGLCAALAFIHRNIKRNGEPGGRPGKTDKQPSSRERAARELLQHLTAALQKAGIPRLAEVQRGEHLFCEVRALELDEYMLATRETLRLAIWFRRAVDTLEDAPEP